MDILYILQIYITKNRRKHEKYMDSLHHMSHENAGLPATHFTSPPPNSNPRNHCHEAEVAGIAVLCFGAVMFPLRNRVLLTQAESLHDGTVALDVLALEVVEQRTALAYQLDE